MRHFLLFSLLLLTGFVAAQTPQIALVDLGITTDRPVDIENAGDGSNRLFIVEQRGRIRVYDQNTQTLQAGNFLDLSGRVTCCGERGLLGLVFHPDFASNGYFYVHYYSNGTGGLPNNNSVISRFTVAPGANTVNLNTEQVLMTVGQPFTNHNAGDLAFGPDGYLYIPFGDGGRFGDPNDTGQDPTTFLGKLLRVDVDNPDPGLNYGVPADNPFVSNPAVRNEIWSFGLRNPWRISFDRQTGDLWIGDVGQLAREEIDFEAAGSAGGLNYGWDCREGFINYTGPGSQSSNCVAGSVYTEPIYDYAHTNSGGGGKSVTGGFVYRGQHGADLEGWYVFADYLDNNVYLISPPDGNGARTTDIQSGTGVSRVSTFGEDETGNLFVANLSSGAIQEVTTQLSLPAEITRFSATGAEKYVSVRWEVATEIDVRDYTVERSADGVTFTALRTVPADQSATYEYRDRAALRGDNYYRLRTRDTDGAEALSVVRRVDFGLLNGELLVSPNPAFGRFSVRTGLARDGEQVSLQLIDAGGRVLLQRESTWVGGGTLEVAADEVPTGVYQVVLRTENGLATTRIVLR